MKAHIVGGGFAGLAAAAYLVRNAGVPAHDITIYEAAERMGGGFFLGGSVESGYSLWPSSIFDAQFRCTFELLQAIPSASDRAISVKDEFFTFNTRHPAQAHGLDRNGHILVDRSGRIMPQSPRFGLSLQDGISLARLSLTPEKRLAGRRIDEFFSPSFFSSQFWWLWSTLRGSLPQHSATEFRRYINRVLALLPELPDMVRTMRTPVNEYQAFIEPMVAWLRTRGVNLLNGAFVFDLGLESSQAITVNRLDYERDGATTSLAVGADDVVLVTIGSQTADIATGSMSRAPSPRSTSGRSWALWRRLAGRRADFGNPEAFFGPQLVPAARWGTFTVTTTGAEFLDQMAALTGGRADSGGLVTLIESSWVLSLTIFEQPEIIGQPPGTSVWWGYGLYPERNGDFVRKSMAECTGAEVLQEVLRQLRFGQMDAIMASSICIPCDMPYVNNIWAVRGRADRPQVVPEGSTNLGLIGQYVDVPQDIAFTIEYSARTAWEAIYRLLRRGPPPPPVYQGQYDLKLLFAVLKMFLAS